MNVRKWLMSLVLLPSVLMAETREVTNAVDLVKALTELNGNTANVIKLVPGNYDVSEYEMFAGAGTPGAYTTMPAHLLLQKASVIGQSDNPRDTVVYGNLTKVIFKTEGGVIRNLTVSNGYNSTSGSYGAGLSGAGSGTYGGAACSNLVLTCNDCSASNGGGGAGMGTCYDCECCYNKANHGAGAAYVTKATRFYIHDNVATSTGGGALNGSYYDSVIVNNQADHFAGYSANSPFTCWNTTIVSNTAKYAAGAGALTTGQRETFVNCTFAFNKATSTYGGAGEKLSLTNCLVYGNRATTYGGGVVNSEVSGGVISNNVATVDDGGGVYVTGSSSVFESGARCGTAKSPPAT